MKALQLSYLMGWPMSHVRINTASTEEVRTYSQALQAWREHHEEERMKDRAKGGQQR